MERTITILIDDCTLLHAFKLFEIINKYQKILLDKTQGKEHNVKFRNGKRVGLSVFDVLFYFIELRHFSFILPSQLFQVRVYDLLSCLFHFAKN